MTVADERVPVVGTVDLGARIKAARVASGLTQHELADGALRPSSISRYEAGLRRPDARTLEHLAKRLETTSAELLAGVPPERRPTMERKLHDAELALSAGELHTSRRLAELVVRTTGRTSDRDLAVRARLVLASTAEAEGDNDGAIAILDDLRVAADGQAFAAVGVALCRCYREAGRLDEAVTAAEEFLCRFRAKGLEGSDEHIMVMLGLAETYSLQADLNRARRLCSRATSVAKAGRSTTMLAAAYWHSSMLEYVAGDTKRALDFGYRALAIYADTGSTRNVAGLRILLADYWLEGPQPDYERADELLGLASREAEWSSASPTNAAQIAVNQAKVHIGRGRPRDAAGALARIPASVERQVPLLAVSAAILRGVIRAGLADVVQASRWLDTAREILDAEERSDPDIARLWRELGEARHALGDADGALLAYRRAALVGGAGKPARASRAGFPLPHGSGTRVP
ncbi:MAG: helix-turn-helix domain-containing protein [Nocardioides sp.]